MYTGLSYAAILGRYFIGAPAAAFIGLFAYRAMVSPASCKCHRSRNRCMLFYMATYMVIAALASFADPFEGVGCLMGLSLSALLTMPALVGGAIGIAMGFSWPKALLSVAVETALFPVWFRLMFGALMHFDAV